METAATRERAEQFRALFSDQVAFRAWYESAFRTVYSFVFARCGGSPAVAAELTQGTFLEVVRHRASFDGLADPVTWVCSIARHKVADHFREIDRQERRQLRLVDREAVDEDRAVERVQSREDVRRALNALPAMQRAVLTMCYLDDLPVREIAAVVGRSESSVESLLTRARESFRRRYGSALEDDDG